MYTFSLFHFPMLLSRFVPYFGLRVFLFHFFPSTSLDGRHSVSLILDARWVFQSFFSVSLFPLNSTRALEFQSSILTLRLLLSWILVLACFCKRENKNFLFYTMTIHLDLLTHFSLLLLILLSYGSYFPSDITSCWWAEFFRISFSQDLFIAK